MLLAKDHATREFWWHNKEFLKLCSEKRNREVQPEEFEQKKSSLYFQEAEIFYLYPSCPHAFYHRAIKVKGILSSMIDLINMKISLKLS